MDTLIHTKVYGTGVKDLLAQAEIKGIYDSVEGVLKIELAPDRCLTITRGVGQDLSFFIETTKSPLEFSY